VTSATWQPDATPRPSSKPATIDFYSKKLKHLLEYEPLAKRKLDGIDEKLIDAYKQKRARTISRYGRLLSPGSINRELATLRRLLRLAWKWKLIDRVPEIKLLRGERQRDFILSREQEANYLAVAPPDLHDVAVLMLDTGMRIGEALSLRWEAVTLQPAPGARNGYATVVSVASKNSKARNVPLTTRVVEMLRARSLTSGELVFVRTGGRPLVATWLNERHRALRAKLKLTSDFVPHSFRHTFGTRLGEAGADPFTIMKLMGHSSVVVSQRYVHPTPETLELAVERMAALNVQSGVTNALESPQISPQ